MGKGLSLEIDLFIFVNLCYWYIYCFVPWYIFQTLIMKSIWCTLSAKLMIIGLLCQLVWSGEIQAQVDDTIHLPFDNGQNGEMSRKEYKKLLRRINASDDFFFRLKRKADSGYIYKQIYPLLFRKPQTAEDLKIINLPANVHFKKYKNDVIRSVRIIKVNIFGSSIYDTIQSENTGIIKTLNSIHFPTLDAVIMNYLLFKEGDRLDPVVISDNERIIRNAPIFEDARFIVDPVNKDTVDLILVVKDIFPLGADVKINSLNSASIRVLNRNIFGLGHQLHQTFGFNNKYSPSFYLGEGAYTIRNIRHNFIDFTVFWANTPLNRRIGMDITRPFLTPEIKLAGGLNVTFQEAWLFNNRSYDRYKYSYRLFDFWTGYAFITHRLRDISSRRQQIAFTGRIYQLDYFQTPDFYLLNSPPMINTTRILLAFNILRSEYYRTNMLYGYGRTEDIPFGHHAEVVTGWEFTELTHRFYSALKVDFLKPVLNAGLFGVDLQIGGYLSQNGYYEEGILKTTLKVISPLLSAGRHSIRNFGSLGFTAGLDRNTPGSISINDGNSGNIFGKYDITGFRRLRGRIESVIFTPYYFLGFRFAPFGFVEAAMISRKHQPLFHQRIYPALGLGIRLRNENLVFSTFQISLSWHPIAPDNVSPAELLFSDLPPTGLERYLIDKPEPVVFK